MLSMVMRPLMTWPFCPPQVAAPNSAPTPPLPLSRLLSMTPVKSRFQIGPASAGSAASVQAAASRVRSGVVM
ncbi:MAG: hypothetical protein C0505_01850 [Leptothrix sp. (in: Bacteria)]|nr:hypothetical protein [Leptothrix sp. (in: b-proteobacteria)]